MHARAPNCEPLPQRVPGGAKLNRGNSVLWTLANQGVANRFEVLTFRTLEYETHTLTLYVTDFVGDAVALARLNAIAHVRWSAGGVTQSAEVDFANGCVLSLAAESVYVEAEVLQREGFIQARFGAFVTRGNTTPGKPVTRTVPLITVPNGNFQEFPVPPYARTVWLMGHPQAQMQLATMIANQYGGADNGTQLLATTGFNLLAFLVPPGTTEWPLHPACRTLEVVNNTAGVTNVSPVFCLDL